VRESAVTEDLRWEELQELRTRKEAKSSGKIQILRVRGGRWKTTDLVARLEVEETNLKRGGISLKSKNCSESWGEKELKIIGLQLEGERLNWQGFPLEQFARRRVGRKFLVEWGVRLSMGEGTKNRRRGKSDRTLSFSQRCLG